MDITEFFQQSAGKWFSQRTSHDLTANRSVSGKSDLWVDVLPVDDPDVVRLCQQVGVVPTEALLGVRVRWEGEIDGDRRKQKGSALLVPCPQADTPQSGVLLRIDDQSAGKSCYSLGTDDALTIVTETTDGVMEDRIWFASPTLRFRTSTLKRPDGYSLASFCSEVRLMSVPPTSTPSQTVAQT